MAPGDLSRDELIALVARIMRVETNDEAEEDRLVELFASSVIHPAAIELIFWHNKHFDAEPTPEQVVDKALSYKPLQL